MRGRSARVLVVDDDPATSTLLRLALTGEGYAVHVEGDAGGGERAATAFAPDLAVLDVRLAPGGDGLLLARRLRASSGVPIMFVTAAGDVASRVAGFEAGADDYLTKPFAMVELLLRVRALLRRCSPTAPTVHQVGPLVVDEAAHVVRCGGDAVELTPTDFELLAVMATAPGRVFSKRQLLESVCGSDTFDTNLVEVHVSSLRRRLEAHGPRMVQTVRGVGYVVRA